MAVVFIIAVLQIWGTQKLKEEGSRVIFHPSVICCSYYTCCISLQGSFLIRRGHANLPLTPFLWQTCTQYAIYSPSYNHSRYEHRAFLGVSSVFLQALAGLSFLYPKEDPFNETEDDPHGRGLNGDTAPLWTAPTPADGGELQCPTPAGWETGSTCLEKHIRSKQQQPRNKEHSFLQFSFLVFSRKTLLKTKRFLSL